MADYPLIIICGESGTGKSYSLRNLDKERTKIINIENKILPFKEALKFKNYSAPETCEAFDREVLSAFKDESLDIIVFESFTKYIEKLLEKAKDEQKGYEIYNYYNKMIRIFLNRIKKNNNKFVILTALPERVEFIQPSGAITTSRRVTVSGKEHEGKIEKEFTIVLFTDVRQEKEKGKPPEYRFITNNDGTHSAKSPPDMFSGQYIPNDLNDVINKICAYYEIKLNSQLSEEEKKSQEVSKPKIPVLQTYGN